MTNFQYKNINDILTTVQPIRGVRYITKNLNKNIVVPQFTPIEIKDDPTNIELHVFLPNASYIGSMYDVSYTLFTPLDSAQNQGEYIDLDIHKHLSQMNVDGLRLTPGHYMVVYNFFRNFIGSHNSSSKLFISEISSDRRELRLALTKNDDIVALKNLSDFILSYLRESKYIIPVVLNFGDNKILDVINVTSDGSTDYLYVKLLDPLPPEIDMFFECWLGSQVLKPYIDKVQLIRQDDDEVKIPYIKGPNFEIEYDYWVNTEIGYKSWNDLLSQNVNTSQQILDRYIQNSGSPVKLNTNFSEFENFVFYSSAEDRVDNFFYKVELIETYNKQLDLLATYTGSVNENEVKIKSFRDKVISGFDDFEKWLYFEENADTIYTPQATASITPYPKYVGLIDVTPVGGSGSFYDTTYYFTTKRGKYGLLPTTNEEVVSWYDDLIEKARSYDIKNYNSLNKSIPEHLREDGQSEQFTTFVNMIGQHFDVIYLYTDHILRKNLREENPEDGLSQDLIYQTTRNLGWTLTHGTQAKDLWEYALGVSGSGEPIWTGKTTVGRDLSKTAQERTREVWRRILNNLPYIYKTKGTSRSIRALLSAYGIPQTLLTIREFGGPDNADLGILPRAELEKHTYYLNFSGSYPLPSPNHYIQVPWERVQNIKDEWHYPDTVTFRWKMEPAEEYEYLLDPNQTVLQKTSGSAVNWFVSIHKDGTDYDKGRLTFHLGNGTSYKTASITDEYLFDDVPLNIMLRRSSTNDSGSANQTYEFILKTGKYGKLAIERSASIDISGSVDVGYNESWSSDGKLYIGSGSNYEGTTTLSGSVYELRYWTHQLLTSSFNNHVLAPNTYNGNTPTSSFHDLQARFRFSRPDFATDLEFEESASIASSHPDRTKSTFYSSSKDALLYGFFLDSFESITETVNMEVATIANNTPFAEKVRIDSASLMSDLNPHEEVSITSFDRYSVDSEKLMVAFSPQSIINEDIYATIGYTTLDDYLGEYDNVDRDEYPRLKKLARDYWRKYPNKNDFTAYLNLISVFDFSVFDQIRQTLPARTNPILGLVIEPNLLERSKVKAINGIKAEPTEKFVKDSNEISKLGDLSASQINTKTTIFVGFEDNELPSEMLEVDGDYEMVYDTISEINDGEDIELEDEIDYAVLPKVSSTNEKVTISKNTTPTTKFTNNKVDMKVVADPATAEQKYTSHKLVIKNDPTSVSSNNNSYLFVVKSTKKASGFTTYTPAYGHINAKITSTYTRDNFKYNPLNTDIDGIPIDVGYGNGWYKTKNDSNKALSTVEQICNYRTDDHYKELNLIYTSSYDILEQKYYSYTYVTSSYVNPYNLPTGLKNRKFMGSRIVDPDINIPKIYQQDPGVSVKFNQDRNIRYSF
jgi:hypothetical protein